MWNSKCRSEATLVGRTAVVTGCNTGIGKETVRDFYKRGCRVVMACRDVVKAEAAAQEIRAETPGVGTLVVVKLDLSSMTSVRECAAHLLRTEQNIHLLVNNAGIAAIPRTLSEDGYEMQFATNHLGHFLLTLLLLPRVLESAPARIVNVASVLHKTTRTIDFDDINMSRGYNGPKAYCRSKLANVLFTKELARRLEGTGVSAYSLHPGVIDTEIYRHTNNVFPGARWLMRHVVSLVIKTPVQGAQTIIHCSVDDSVATESGLYYVECKKTTPSRSARDPKLALRLWEESLKMVGLENSDSFSSEKSGDPKVTRL